MIRNFIHSGLVIASEVQITGRVISAKRFARNSKNRGSSSIDELPELTEEAAKALKKEFNQNSRIKCLSKADKQKLRSDVLKELSKNINPMVRSLLYKDPWPDRPGSDIFPIKSKREHLASEKAFEEFKKTKMTKSNKAALYNLYEGHLKIAREEEAREKIPRIIEKQMKGITARYGSVQSHLPWVSEDEDYEEEINWKELFEKQKKERFVFSDQEAKGGAAVGPVSAHFDWEEAASNPRESKHPKVFRESSDDQRPEKSSEKMNFEEFIKSDQVETYEEYKSRPNVIKIIGDNEEEMKNAYALYCLDSYGNYQQLIDKYGNPFTAL